KPWPGVAVQVRDVDDANRGGATRQFRALDSDARDFEPGGLDEVTVPHTEKSRTGKRKTHATNCDFELRWGRRARLEPPARPLEDRDECGGIDSDHDANKTKYSDFFREQHGPGPYLSQGSARNQAMAGCTVTTPYRLPGVWIGLSPANGLICLIGRAGSPLTREASWWT